MRSHRWIAWSGVVAGLAATGWVVVVGGTVRPGATRESDGVSEETASAPALRGAAGEREATLETGEAPAGRSAAPLAVPATLDVRVRGWMRRPLAGAVVTLEEQAEEQGAVHEPKVTGRDGRVRFTGIRSPYVSFWAACAGHVSSDHSPDAVLRDGETREVEVALEPRGRVEGRVLAAADDRPIPGAKVRVRTGGLAALHREERWGEYWHDGEAAETDEQGRYVLPDVGLHEPHGVWVEAAGYERADRALEISAPDEPYLLEFRLHRAGRLRATVLDEAGRPVVGRRIVLVPRDHAGAEGYTLGSQRLNETDEDREADGLRLNVMAGSWFGPHSTPVYAARTGTGGVAVIEGLRLGRAFRVVRGEDLTWMSTLPQGYLSPVQDIVPTDERPEVVLDLREERAATLVLKCSGASGTVEEGASLEFDGGIHEGPKQGVWRVESLAPGRVTGVVRCEGYVPFEIGVDLRPGEVREVEVRLEAAEPSPDVDLESARARQVSVTARLLRPAGLTPDEVPDFDWGIEPASFPRLYFCCEHEEARGDRRRWDLTPGNYVLRAWIGDEGVFARPFTVGEQDALDLGAFEPVLGGPVEVQVVFADRAPAPFARVNLRDVVWRQADAGGRFRLAHAPTWPVTAVVGIGDLPAQVLELPPRAAGLPWRIVVQQGGMIRGVVPGADEASGLTVDVRPVEASGRAPRRSPTLDSGGRFTAAVLPGLYEVSLLRGSDSLSRAVVRVTDGEVSEVAFAASSPR